MGSGMVKLKQFVRVLGRVIHAPEPRDRSFRPAHRALQRASLVALIGLGLGAATPCLAQEPTFSLGLGPAFPLGGAKDWVSSNPGISLDLMESFELNHADRLRMRLGGYFWQATGANTENLAESGTGFNTFQAAATNQLFGFSYSVEYLKNLPHGVYLLGGIGLTYISASRSGTVDLQQGAGPQSFKYDSNKLSPYACLGAGYTINQYIALEGRLQVATLGSQTRSVQVSSVGTSPTQAQATVPSITAASAVVGVVFLF